ncbi:BlaI/MecI/CopY family transcriptional regulator [Anaerolentibacter hominis]|uniref:BlaI/MecI/CopY family transcriptional regulator n=1 Tax=Anaerolentibacter hominis TaxID=3079009 RepID=UPI0031B857E8
MIGLSDGEWKIMKLLWESAPRTIMQLTSALEQDTGWGKHTVITMLNRMEKKGAVYYKEGVRAKQYFPAVEQEAVSARETEGFLNKVYGGSLSLLVNTMVEQESLSSDEIDELYDILKKAEERKS